MTRTSGKTPYICHARMPGQSNDTHEWQDTLYMSCTMPGQSYDTHEWQDTLYTVCHARCQDNPMTRTSGKTADSAASCSLGSSRTLLWLPKARSNDHRLCRAHLQEQGSTRTETMYS